MPIPTDDAPVVDDTDAGRFVIREGGTRAELVYLVQGDRMVLFHTGVPEEWGGHGIGGRLVRAALARAAVNNLTVVPWCPFARRWLRDHPDEGAAVIIDWDSPRPRHKAAPGGHGKPLGRRGRPPDEATPIASLGPGRLHTRQERRTCQARAGSDDERERYCHILVHRPRRIDPAQLVDERCPG